ncbi:NrsF family protein [Rhizobium sp. A22-96]
MTKIDNLIDTLVADLTPVSRHALRMRLASAIIFGVIGAAFALFASFAFRSHSHHVTMAAFWVKFLYSAGLMGATIIALDHVARPDGLIGNMIRVSMAAFAVIALLAIGQLVLSPTSSYPGLIFGFSALFCPFLIVAFGLPAFFANMWFLRRAAPFNPGLAGFVAGACAGAIGAWVYALACVENGIPFIALWYTLGILLSGLLGSVVGKLSLRW